MISTRLLPHLLALVAAVLPLSHVAAEGQLGARPEIIPKADSQDEFYAVQKTTDGKLILTPNESFFPALGLRAMGESKIADIGQWNGQQSFAEIRGWETGSVAEWGVWLPQKGELCIAIDATPEVPFAIALDDELQTITHNQPAIFAVSQSGKHSVRLWLNMSGATSHRRDQRSAEAASTTLRRLTITGSSATGAAVIRKRWRPAAAHTKFSSSQAREAIRLWVMEMDAVPGPLGFYCPITTPFGYYGPTWNADGTVNTSFNFSLWSFGRNQPEPPVQRLSHLLAIGDRKGRFGGFDHEGTGVKIRDWEPLANRQGQRQAIALRVEPGAMYDTYHSYFYATDEKRWRLFGSGNKYNQGKPLKSLWVGSFVEVPGPPPVQRTGVYPRSMRYRGWVMDQNGHWHVLDQMRGGNVDKNTGLTHTRRGVTEDGWFFLETGGWTLRHPPHDGKDIRLTDAVPRELPEYMQPEQLKPLASVPTRITDIRLGAAGKTDLQFSLFGAGARPELTIFWGPDEALTFAERWPHAKVINNVREGANTVAMPELMSGQTTRVRLLLKNDDGQFWSLDTLVVEL